MNEQHHPEASGLSRRDFVRVSAVAAAVPVLSSGLASPLVHAAGSDTMKIGLIGCGGRGTGAATQALAADKGLVLWSMGDVFKDRLDSAHKNITDWIGDAEQHPKGRTITKEQLNVGDDRRFTGFDSYQRVIDSGIDAVLLTSYPCFRPAHLHAAIKAGKHVFAEKPIAVDAPGYRAFCAAGEEAKSKNLGVLIGFCWRHHPGMKEAFDKILSGSIGDVNSAYTTYLTGTLGKRPRQPEWSDVEFQMRNWWHFTWISGDHIVEQAVHSIDRLAWAMGD
ncbi:MAG: Gfo/Idh/MocA family oxidoreductase, partial [Phycisphaerae bacterium]|nr:Gfo/Idh/MocA family oxidoreductase [Phycisphaerae bacterium]